METTNDEENNESDNGYDDDYEDGDDNEHNEMNNDGKVLSRSTTTVNSFILWKKDVAPSPTDPRLNAIESWINIADLVSAYYHFDRAS